MKAIIVSKIHKEHSLEIDRIGLRIEVTDPELIKEILNKNGIILYTESEYRDLKSRIEAALVKIDRLTTGNVAHTKGNIKMILGGI